LRELLDALIPLPALPLAVLPSDSIVKIVTAIGGSCLQPENDNGRTSATVCSASEMIKKEANRIRFTQRPQKS
jgi:hypothetical protein